jgi:hypothetical protein
MREKKWTALSLLAGTALLGACGTASSDFVAPDMPAYSPAFQDKAADELTEADRPCDRVEPVPPCSATARLVIDYGMIRQQIRAVR